MAVKQIKVVYVGEINPYLDKEITIAMKSIGWAWYAQGQDRQTLERDIAFTYDVKDENEKGS